MTLSELPHDAPVGQSLTSGFIRLYDRTTPPGAREFMVLKAKRMPETRNASWDRPALSGSPSGEGDQYFSTFAQRDLTAGFGIQDADEGVNMQNFRFGKVDARRVGQICKVPKTYTPANPSWASGDSFQLGDIPNNSTFISQMYTAWGSSGAAGFDWSTGAYYTTQNALSGTPARTGTLFNRRLYVPFTGSGGIVLEESTANTGTLTSQAITPAAGVPDPRIFIVWSNKLWCIDKSNKLWFQLVIDADTKAHAGTAWNKKLDSSLNQVTLDLSHTPKDAVINYNAAQQEVIVLSTNHGLFMLNEGGPDYWIESTMEPSPHPGFGVSMITWRGGEDLYVAAGGLDIMKRTTAQVDVPLQGPSRMQGVPPNYTGEIVSLSGDRSCYYYLIKGLPPSDEAAFFEDIELQDHPYTAVAPVPAWLGCNTGEGNFCLWDDLATTGIPNWLRRSVVSNGYAMWWGGSDGQSHYMRIPLDFLNPDARIQLRQSDMAFAVSVGSEPASWLESIRFDGNIIGWDFLASHIFAIMGYASSLDYLKVYYRTDADAVGINEFDPGAVDPPWNYLGTVQTVQRNLIYFDNDEIDEISNLPWREGQQFQWIQYRLEWYGENDELSAILSAISFHHLKIPQDSGTFEIEIDLHHDRLAGEHPRDRWNQIKAFQNNPLGPKRSFTHCQLDDFTVLRGRVTSVRGERYVGGNNWPSVAVTTFVELNASNNAYTTIVSS